METNLPLVGRTGGRGALRPVYIVLFRAKRADTISPFPRAKKWLNEGEGGGSGRREEGRVWYKHYQSCELSSVFSPSLSCGCVATCTHGLCVCVMVVCFYCPPSPLPRSLPLPRLFLAVSRSGDRKAVPREREDMEEGLSLSSFAPPWVCVFFSRPRD